MLGPYKPGLLCGNDATIEKEKEKNNLEIEIRVCLHCTQRVVAALMSSAERARCRTKNDERIKEMKRQINDDKQNDGCRSLVKIQILSFSVRTIKGLKPFPCQMSMLFYSRAFSITVVVVVVFGDAEADSAYISDARFNANCLTVYFFFHASAGISI